MHEEIYRGQISAAEKRKVWPQALPGLELGARRNY